MEDPLEGGTTCGNRERVVSELYPVEVFRTTETESPDTEVLSVAPDSCAQSANWSGDGTWTRDSQLLPLGCKKPSRNRRRTRNADTVRWDSTAPIPKSEASTSMTNWSLGSGMVTIGAEVILSFKALNTSSASWFHKKKGTVVRVWRGVAMELS